MNPLAIAAGILVVFIALILTGNLTSWFVEAQQIQLIYIGIVVFAGMILIGAFNGR